jgi:hypothetical protein
MLLNFMDATFAQILVSALGDGPPADAAAFLAVRNRPLVLALVVATHALAALLVGYILGRIAGAREVRHALAAAIVITVVYVVAFVGNNPMLPPVWVRVAMLVLTPPALVGGAHIRGEARAVHDEQTGTVRSDGERRQGVPADQKERRQGVPADQKERRQGVPADQEERRQGVPADEERS